MNQLDSGIEPLTPERAKALIIRPDVPQKAVEEIEENTSETGIAPTLNWFYIT